MTRQSNRPDETAALKRLLDAFGADPARWPAGAWDRFRPLLAAVPEARALFAEARALDRVLGLAQQPSRDRVSRIADRIVASAMRMPGVDEERSAGSGHIIALPVRGRSIGKQKAFPARSVWPAASLLAACLLAGVYLGSATYVHPVVQQFAHAVGISANLDTDSYALYEEVAEEDAL